MPSGEMTMFDRKRNYILNPLRIKLMMEGEYITFTVIVPSYNEETRFFYWWKIIQNRGD